MNILQKLNVSPERIPRWKFKLHIAIGLLVFITFILAIARIADGGTPKSRTNTWGIAVCVKSAVFMAYQITTAHVNRLKRWANTKVNITLNIIDTVFWFALFIITIMGSMGSTSSSSKALGAITIILAFILVPLAGYLSFLCICERRYYKRHGMLPGEVAKYSGV
ncbi:hypothetical protein ASPSYDRAFT_164463 [Aspergillus sydowii CBS 593.65]|uniref:MARVEL domain-containing protein n=1 Tax=Aspergillus sydowii CBS 593.65 TaxID=1036612 RepID=A0A1L9SZ41_9EURO|nr:uncharacterized protein ASPSYDRAFT_164463 [Aspergillus sydowii CBS 593.65]OJJ52435.1 hypothetical protein ASPSYDRAFT_164463 [Aspergillus sydowii CBS 593.65]